MADPNWDNRTLFVADNIHILRGMNSESVDLIATDPPFNAKRLFNAPLGSRAAKQRFDDRWRWDEVTNEWHDLIASDHPAIQGVIEAAAVIEGGGESITLPARSAPDKPRTRLPRISHGWPRESLRCIAC